MTIINLIYFFIIDKIKLKCKTQSGESFLYNEIYNKPIFVQENNNVSLLSV